MPAPNIFNFFKPRKGHPFTKKGMAEFLSANGKAWASLDVLGGEVSWDHGMPTIIAPTTNQSTPLPFDLQVVGSVLQVYAPSDGSKNVYLQGVPVVDTDTTPISDSSWRVTSITLPVLGNTIDVYVCLEIADLTATNLTAGAMKWAVKSGSSGLESWQRARPIASVTNASGQYIIRQHVRGAIAITGNYADTLERDKLGAGTQTRGRSIENRGASGSGALQLYKYYDDPQDYSAVQMLGFSVQDNWDVIMRRRQTTSNYEVDYIKMSSFKAMIDSLIDSAVPYPPVNPDEPWPTPPDGPNTDWDNWLLSRMGIMPHNNLTGKQGGDGSDPSNLQYYHLTEEQHARVTELSEEPEQAAISDVPTGANADAEANATAINSILAALRAANIIATT